MTAAKLWRMWAFPFRGTFRHATPATIWLHRALVALAGAGLLAGVVRRRAPLLGLVLLAVGVTTGVDVAFVAEARHAFRLLPSLLAGGAAGWPLLANGQRRPSDADRPRPRDTSRRHAR
jgi:hypothetical protein